MGKARRIQTSADRLRKNQIEIKQLQGLIRNSNTPRPVASTAFAGVSAAGDNGSTGNFLRTAGDTMIGPFALAPPVDFSIDIDADGIIDIGESSSNSQYTSNIQLEDIQPNTFTLDTIAGAAFDGQILILRTFAPSTPITIAQATFGNGGNIQTLSDADVTMGNLQTKAFIFDASLIIFGNAPGGTWRELTGGTGGGGGVSFPIDFPITFLGTIGSITQIIDFSLSTRHGWKAEFNGDVELAFTNPPTGELGLATFKFKQDGTGGHTLTLPAGTVNKDIVEAGFLLGVNEETGIGVRPPFVSVINAPLSALILNEVERTSPEPISISSMVSTKFEISTLGSTGTKTSQNDTFGGSLAPLAV